MAAEPTVVETTETVDLTASGQDASQNAGGTPEKYADWDALVKAHPEVGELYEGKTSGLKSALDKERDKAAEASKALRTLAKEADEKTAAALKKQADEMDAAVEDARRESTFYREAAAAGIPGDRLARAWLIAKNGDYFTKRGDPDIQSLKTELPELFTQPAAKPRPTAGAGTQQGAAPSGDFNSNVRRIARGETPI
jgi:hypothetical protein